jgi:hypothetical protein
MAEQGSVVVIKRAQGNVVEHVARVLIRTSVVVAGWHDQATCSSSMAEQGSVVVNHRVQGNAVEHVEHVGSARTCS